MKENVLIILNERESSKKNLAEELEKRLLASGITSARLDPEPNLFEIIQERKIEIIVLDFILDKYGTALDLINSIKKSKNQYSPEIIVWTDEPSLSSATQALRMGAADYIELYKKDSLEKITKRIDELYSKIATFSNKKQKTIKKRKQIIGQSKIFLKALSCADAAANKNNKIITLLGEEGSGKNTIAEYIHAKRLDPGLYQDIDFRYFAGELRKLFLSHDNNTGLTGNSTLFIDHIDYDTSEILEELTKDFLKEKSNELLILGTSCSKTAKACFNLLGSEVIEIPCLKDRTSDLLPLIDYFSLEISKSGLKSKNASLSKEFISLLSQLEWPRNIRELKAVIQDMLSFPEESLKELYEDEDENLNNLNLIINELNSYEKTLYKCLVDSKKRFSNLSDNSKSPLNSFEIYEALDKSSNNYRIAAAMLGCSVNSLKYHLKYHLRDRSKEHSKKHSRKHLENQLNEHSK